MGRRIEIKKILETTRRQVAFSKRHTCLLKKVKEIAICCDVDLLFFAFSSNDRLSKFCSQKRIKDMLQRYIELPVDRRLAHMADVQMELEKQEKMEGHFVAQQTAPHQFDTNNWINPYSSDIQESIYHDWMNEGKGIANSSGNYTYTPSFASSSRN
ncbi:protein TRANSPARENT TESTA 16-like [Solanum pennellii]|uniref:Protein TRANSPARENT TESTA 16-like n=1 Tax=Solanum pennellii TaxID=28526 RepID=A0ABM1VEF9_SOLPN|nr:protein TRANSPARENT TESTA 16-like [Solanum pennellii]